MELTDFHTIPTSLDPFLFIGEKIYSLDFTVTNLLFDDKLSEFESCLSTLKIDMEFIE